MSPLCVFMLRFTAIFSQKINKKTSEVTIVCSGQKKFFLHILQFFSSQSLIRDVLDIDLRRCKKDGYVAHWKVAPNLLWHMKSETF